MKPYCQFCGIVTDHFWYACPKRPKTSRGAPRVETKPLEPPPKPRRQAMAPGLLGTQPKPVTKTTSAAPVTPPVSVTAEEVPKNKGGRPRTGKAVPAAERMKAYRQRKKARSMG